jgi:hypothetical protein
VDTNTLLQGTNTLRAFRQQCGLLGGAGNLSRNFAARFVSLKIRLAPSVKSTTTLSTDYLFPPPNEDACLRTLLERSEARQNNTLFPVYHLG